RKLPFIGSFHTLIQYATHYLSRKHVIQDIAKRIAWKYLRWYYNKCNITIVPSNTIRDLLESNGFRNIRVIPNGVDIEFFSNAQRNRGMFNLKEDDAVFLFVGRLVHEKNLDVLIRASKKIIKEIPDARFVIAGTGPAEQYYKELVAKEKVSGAFDFLGFVEEHKVAHLYKSADVFVFPSKFETQGLSGIEAMSGGLPVCGADYLALKEIVIEGYNGMLFNPDSPEECAEKAILTYSKRQALGVNAIKTAMKFSHLETTKLLKKVYEEVAGT
ncbi:MAG: glycosyltransferase, partial [Fervidobacterium sp.]